MFKSVSSPFLNIGITLAMLSLSGNIPVPNKTWLVIKVSGFTSSYCITMMCFIDKLSISLLVFGVKLSYYKFKRVTWCVLSFLRFFVRSFVTLASFSSLWLAVTLTVHIIALYNESVHGREEHATWINSIALKIATLLNLQSLKWAYSFRTDVLNVFATSRHYSVLKRQVAPDVSQLLRWVAVNMIHIHHSSDHTNGRNLATAHRCALCIPVIKSNYRLWL